MKATTIELLNKYDFEPVIDEVFDAALFQLSDILPSDWSEKYRIMTSEVSNQQGPFSFKNSPYTLKIINTIAQNHPARVIVIMKGAQIGLSTSFIENAIGYIISEAPSNILFLVGHDDLVKKAMAKVDNMLSTTGLRASGVIRSNANRTTNNKTGDNDTLKEFAGGSLTLGPTNHKSLRQASYKYGFIDDFEAMRSSSKESGDTVALIKQRFASFANTYKLCFISTPEVEETSNIKGEYEKGDKQKYHIPCPCCDELITLEWESECKNSEVERAGITWKLNEYGQLIEDSVGYICQLCGGFFDESHKNDFLLPVEFGGRADWFPTELNPKDPDYISFHISALYAPSYMFGWKHYVKQYLDANPVGADRDEAKHQTFMNLVLGLPYKMEGKKTSAKDLQKNIRQYQIGTIPDKLSISDGNGRIVLITIGADMNGKEDDARIDWEIVGWSESGSSYSIDQGSVGTFIPGESKQAVKVDRKKWTYRIGLENSVWPILEEIANRVLIRDSNNKTERIHAGCLDTGYFTTDYAYPYIEHSSFAWFGVKGDKATEIGIQQNADYKPFHRAKERSDLWILNVNLYKDHLATSMGKTWSEFLGSKQPGGFMNFPTPSDGKYLYHSYFIHFEGEEKISDKGKFVWKKVQGKQNHFWDCRVYNMAARDLAIDEIFRHPEIKITNGTYADFVRLINSQNK
jgi:phage terminase large subunit GpA-like protein